MVLLAIALCIPSFLFGDEKNDHHYSADAVWKLADPQSAFKIWHECDGLDCILASLKKAGAGKESMDFVRAIKGEGYLATFEHKGTVDLGKVVFPSRANTNEAYVLLNGNPDFVTTELHDGVLNIKEDPNYATLKQQYPNIDAWSASATFISTESEPAGGLRFVFSYQLINGCHACGVPWSAQVAFDFARDGEFKGRKILKLVPQTTP